MRACPDYPRDCSRGGPTRPLTDGEKLLLVGRAANFTDGAEKCGYCGLVFVPDRNSPHRLGWIDNALVGEGFHPVMR
jgi:hypothetical protein